MRVRVLSLGIAVMAGACGGKAPAAPSAPASLSVPAGEYAVTMSAAGAGGVCFGVSSDGQRPDTVTFTGRVTADAGTFTLRPSGAADRGLVVMLRAVTAGSIAGPAAGEVGDESSDVVASVRRGPTNLNTGEPGADAVFVGSNVGTADPRLFVGTVTGSISWSGPGGSTTCMAATWAMRPK